MTHDRPVRRPDRHVTKPECNAMLMKVADAEDEAGTRGAYSLVVDDGAAVSFSSIDDLLSAADLEMGGHAHDVILRKGGRMFMRLSRIIESRLMGSVVIRSKTAK